MKNFLLIFLSLLLSSFQLFATPKSSVAGSVNWNTAGSWSPTGVPGSGDDVTIISGSTVTVNTAAVCNTLTINAPTTANGITISSPNSLTVTGAITMNAPTAGVNSTIAVGTGTLGAASISMTGGSSANQNCIVSVSTGTINITGSITFSGTATRAQLTFSGAGNLNIGGTIGSGGTFTASTGTVNFNDGVQTIPALSAAYNNLTLSGTATKTAGSNLVVNGTLTVASNITLDMSTFTLTGTLGTISNSGTIKTSSTTSPPLASNKNWGSAGTIEYAVLTGGQFIPQGTFFNLTLDNTSGTNTGVVGNIVVNGALTITGGTLDMSTYTLTGTLATITNGGTIKTSSTTNPPLSSGETWGGTIEYARLTGGQYIPAGTYSILQLDNTSGSNTIVGSITVNGTLNGGTSSGLTIGANLTLTLSNSTGNQCGPISYSTVNQTLTYAGTSYLNCGTITYGSSGCLITFTGSGTINCTGNTVFASSSGNHLDVGSGLFTCTGDIGNVSCSSSGITCTSGTITCMNIKLGSSSTVSYGSGSINVKGAFTYGSSLTWTPGTGIFNYSGGAQTVLALTYTNLTLSGTGTKTISGVSVNGILSIEGDNTVSLSTAPTFGGSSTIQYKGTGNRTTTVNEFPNGFLGTGGVIIDQGTGTITLNANKTALAGPLNIKSGTLDLSTFTINRVSNTLTLTIAGTLKLGATSGGQTGSNFPTGFTTLTMTDGTVEYSIAGGGQTIYTTPAYNNLTLDNTSGINTVGGNLTVNGILTTMASGTLNMGSNQLLGTLSSIVNGGTISTTNTSSTPIPTGKTWGGTVNYAATTGLQTIMSGTYAILTLSNSSGTNSASGNLATTTLNNASGGILDMVGFTLTGAITNTLSTIRFNGATNGIAVNSGTIDYYGTGQTVATGTYNNLKLSNTTGSNTASGNLIVSSTLTTTASGTLDMSTFMLTVATVANNGIIKTSNTSSTPIPTGKTWGGTVNYAATTGSQTIMAGTYNILTLSNTSGANIASGNLTVTGTFTTLDNGQLDMGSNLLTVTSVANNGTIKTSNTSSTPISTGKTWGGIVIYNAAASQTVSSGTYTKLTISGSGAKTTAGVTVNSILSMEGSATATATPIYGGSASLQYQGNVVQVTGPEFPATAPSGVIIANSNGVTLDAGRSIGVLTIQSNGVFSDGGFAISPATTLNMSSGVYNCNVSALPWGTANLTGGTINYIYAGSQTLPAQTYSNLILSGSGIKTLGGDITVNGALTINPGATGAALDAGNHIITITGAGSAWNNPNNSFTYGTSTVKMQGTLAQSMVGSTFFNLEINNPAGVTLSTSDMITNQLKLTSGQLILNGNPITINSGAVIAGNGGSALSNFNNSNSNYIVTGSGGYVKQYVASSDVIYPVGTASSFTPATLNNTGGTPDNYGVYVVTSTAHTADFAGVVDKQWTVQEDTANLSNLIMTFQWNAPSNEGTLFQPATTASVGIWGGVMGSGYMDITDHNLTIHGSNPRWVKMNQWQDMDFSGSNARTYTVGNNDALPVELSTFTSSANGRNINLNWETKTEKNSDRFIIERTNYDANSISLNWESVGSVKAAVLSNSPKQYSFADKNLQAGKYQYRLKMIDNDGSFAYSIIVDAEVTVPKNFELSQNYPNPFNPTTKINYSLANDSKVSLEVYNIIGERVAQLVNEEQTAGYYTVNFGIYSKNITSGVYIYKITATDNTGKNFSSIKKMMLLK